MDIKEIEKLIQNSSSVLVMEEGKPSFVIMGYDTYKSVASKNSNEKEVKINNHSGSVFGGQINDREAEILERLNKEILALKHQIENEEKSEEY